MLNEPIRFEEIVIFIIRFLIALRTQSSEKHFSVKYTVLCKLIQKMKTISYKQ